MSLLVGENAKELLNGFLAVKMQGSEAVLEFLKNQEISADSNNWHDLGGLPGNSAIVNAQANNAQLVLNEIIMNAIDALIDRKKYEAKLLAAKNGETYEEPNSVAEALKEYFDIDMYDPSSITESKIESLARNIQLIVSGSKTKPNIAVYDRGIGQKVEKFIDTFMSLCQLNKGNNKSNQGVYNMGSSGVLRFCEGGLRFTLTCTPFQDKRVVAFSFVKEVESERIVSYQYFAPGGEVPYFELEEGEGLPLGLLKDEEFHEGTFIEMYSYELKKELQGNVLNNFFSEMQKTLFKSGLPVTVFEKRFTKKGKYDTFIGNHTKFLFEPSLIENEISLGKMTVEPFGDFYPTAYVLSNMDDAKEIIGKRHVIFTNNGQTQASLSKSFVKNQVGFHCLADRLLVHVDCSMLDEKKKHKFFNSDRNGLIDNDKVEAVKDTLASSLFHNETLSKMEEEIREKLENISKASNEDLLKEVTKHFPLNDETKKMFAEAGILNFSHGSARRNPNKNMELTNDTTRKRSIVTLSEGKTKTVRSIPLDGSRSVSFIPDNSAFVTGQEADVKFELSRYKSPNSESSSEGGSRGETNPDAIRNLKDYFNVTTYQDGDVVNVDFMSKKDNLSVGDEVKLEATISFGSEKSFTAIVTLKVTDPQKEDKRKYKKNERGSGMPEPVKVYKEDWQEANFNEDSLISFVTTKLDEERLEITKILVNMDNVHVREYVNSLDPNKVNIDNLLTQYFVNVYIEGLIEYPTFIQLQSKDSDESADEILIQKMEKKATHYASYDSMKLMNQIA